MPDFQGIGDPRPKHPLPKRLRNVNMPAEPGIDGGQGYRGAGYATARKRTIFLAKGRTFQTGMDADHARLTVDHINPYRAGGGLTPHTNEDTNLRVSDAAFNKFIDYAEGAQEGKAKRRLKEQGF
jgi:hypothetical protein